MHLETIDVGDGLLPLARAAAASSGGGSCWVKLARKHIQLLLLSLLLDKSLSWGYLFWQWDGEGAGVVPPAVRVQELQLSCGEIWGGPWGTGAQLQCSAAAQILQGSL